MGRMRVAVIGDHFLGIAVIGCDNCGPLLGLQLGHDLPHAVIDCFASLDSRRQNTGVADHIHVGKI